MPGLTQRITLEGADAIQQALASIGNAGQAAFGKLKQSADQVAPSLNAIQDGAQRIGAAVQQVSAGGNAFKGLGTGAAAAAKSTETVTASVQGVQSPLAALGTAVRGLAGNFQGSGTAASLFGATLRTIGKATGQHELSLLGREVNLLGKSFTLVAPAVLIAGLAKLASSAGEAAEKFADLGAKLRQTPGQLNQLRQITAGAGISSEQMAASAERLQSAMHEAANADAAVAKARRELADATVIANIDSQGFASSMDRLSGAEQHQKAAAEAALASAQQQGNVFNRLGIATADARGKLVALPELYQRLAAVLPNVTDPLQRQEITWDLVAAGIDRRLVPALFQGAAALDKIAAVGKAITNPFTDDKIAAADRYAASLQRILTYLENIKNAAGLSIGQWFTGSSGDSGSGFAAGGYVRGPGSRTSDSILARLSNGEFVMRAAAVEHYGAPFMHAINSMRAFAAGGLVGIPRFAAGGLAAAPVREAMHPVTIHLGGDAIGGLFASTDVANSLVKTATSLRLRRAGRRPGYYGA